MQEEQTVQSDVHDIVKVEHDIENPQCTAINTNTIMRDEYIVGDSDIPNIIKEEIPVGDQDITPSDFSVVIKEEPVTEPAVADGDSGMTEKVFLNEPDQEQFLDEVI